MKKQQHPFNIRTAVTAAVLLILIVLAVWKTGSLLRAGQEPDSSAQETAATLPETE